MKPDTLLLLSQLYEAISLQSQLIHTMEPPASGLYDHGWEGMGFNAQFLWLLSVLMFL